MLFKEWKYPKINISLVPDDSDEIWEKIPDEELWEDGEINESQVKRKVINEVFNTGDWILIRRNEDAK